MSKPKMDMKKGELIFKLTKSARNSLLHGVHCGAVKNTLCGMRTPYIKKGSRKNPVLWKYRAAFFLAACVGLVYEAVSYESTWRKFLVSFKSSSTCAIKLPRVVSEVARPRFNCSFCEGLKTLPVAYSINKETFIEKYAYTDVPLLVKGAASNWTARTAYNYTYFKNLYVSTPESFDLIEKECQFFRYKTEFKNFKEVFKMPDRRANNEQGEKTWYIGWCDVMSKTEQQLKYHYDRPSFLPKAETPELPDWVFMGWQGEGAHVHIDRVLSPSWQAQIKGRKTWRLIPSIECEHICSPINATLEPGDILTVDTNKWHHSTYIHPGDISISIGSEY